ncbi:MAG: dihydroorotate dehydrogenase-like protein [Paracoccaceae bacterium]
MADLTTRWMGLTLQSPVIVGAGPLSQDTASARMAAEAGAGAIVMHSLFEEQLADEQMAAHLMIDALADHDAEVGGFLPHAAFSMDGEGYLAELAALKAAVDVPVIASLNGITPGGWTRYAVKLAAAGADALELNLYDIATDPMEDAAAVEARQAVLVADVVRSVAIPVTVKLAPTYTALPAFAMRLRDAGAKGVTVFNRLFDPRVDLDALEVQRNLEISTPAELPSRLHALAILSARVPGLSLACSGGIHAGNHAAQALACGADVVQVTSALVAHGPDRMAAIITGMHKMLDSAGYATADSLRGILNLDRAPDPTAWTRLNYVRTLDGWRSILNRRA